MVSFLGLAAYLAILLNSIVVQAFPATAMIPNDARAVPAPVFGLRNMLYVQTFSYPNGTTVSLQSLVDSKVGVTHIYLASLHINGPGQLNLNDVPWDDSSWNFLWGEVAALQKAGIKVMAMLGGAGVGSYTRLQAATTAGAYNALYTPLYNLIKTHSLDGLDLDIEESCSQTTALTLLNRLNTDFGPSFLLTMSPVALGLLPIPFTGYDISGISYASLDAASTAQNSNRPGGKLVSWYNVQFYNGWGDASTQIFYDTLVASTQFAPNRVALGVLTTGEDGGSGWYSLATYENVVKQLRANFGSNFGGVIGWEFFNAGTDDGLAQPWAWSKGISTALTAAASILPAKNTTAVPLAQPSMPWPASVKKLEILGAEWWQANWALNVTGGNLPKAEKALGMK